jgi:hypothetical protein
MGSLQLALLAAGAVIIAAVLAFNVLQSWQLRRRRRGAEANAMPADDAEIDAAERREPDLGDAVLDADAARPRSSAPRIDPLIDAIASFLFEQPLPGSALIERLPRAARAGAKPLLFEGRSAADGRWEALQPQVRYAELQAAVQLASRNGALNAIEFSEFVTKCHALGETMGTAPDLPDMGEVLEHARDLDAFAAANDAQLSINLQAQGVAWGVDYLRQQAQAAGFAAVAGAGRLALLETVGDAEDGAAPAPSADGHRLLALVQLQYDAQADLSDDPQLPVSRATLLLDVAQVPQALRPFARMREAAQRLAQALPARQVDDNGAPLSPASLDQIEQQLERLYAALDARGLPAGSAAAQRLFS